MKAQTAAFAKPIRKKRNRTGVRSKVLERVRHLIQTGGLRSGMKLPPERELAARLGVGRPNIREAIKALTMLDVLESRPGAGTFVKSLAGLAFGWGVKLDKVEASFDLIELLEVRKMLEPPAAALAAARADGRQLGEIERELRAQEAHLKDHDLFVQHDYRFHDAIIRAAGNPILIDLTQVLVPLLLKSRRNSLLTRREFQSGFAQHRAIFEAIRLGESDLAERAMLDHLQTVALDLVSQRSRITALGIPP